MLRNRIIISIVTLAVVLGAYRSFRNGNMRWLKNDGRAIGMWFTGVWGNIVGYFTAARNSSARQVA